LVCFGLIALPLGVVHGFYMKAKSRANDVENHREGENLHILAEEVKSEKG